MTVSVSVFGICQSLLLSLILMSRGASGTAATKVRSPAN